jgi:hypothetical protein
VPEFVAPVIERLLEVLQKHLPTTLPTDQEPVTEFGRQFTGVTVSFPAVYVMPLRTVFDEDAQNYVHQAHQIQIKLAVSGSQPGDVTDAAMTYIKAVHLAIAQADAAGEFADAVTAGQVLRVFVSAHDYGPLFDRGSVLARFPEIELLVEVAEAEA